MVLYKANIKPLASFASPLQSDTFFGAFCWSYRYLYGEDELVGLLKKSMNEIPQIIFSNAFPAGYLPLPMGIYDQDRERYGNVEKSEAKKAYEKNKKYKKYSLIRKDQFMDIQKGMWRGYSEYLGSEQITEIEIPHNMISRMSGNVNESEEGGNLFVTSEFFVEDGKTFDLYILSELDKDCIRQVLTLMFELGIGADKSTGKGCFELLEFVVEKELCFLEGANAYMAISNFIPASNDPVNGWYKTFVKNGKLDREYAAGQFPFKKPLMYIQSGAVFKTEDIKSYYGTFMEDIAVINGVVVNACTIAIPMIIPEK